MKTLETVSMLAIVRVQVETDSTQGDPTTQACDRAEEKFKGLVKALPEGATMYRVSPLCDTLVQRLGPRTGLIVHDTDQHLAHMPRKCIITEGQICKIIGE